MNECCNACRMVNPTEDGLDVELRFSTDPRTEDASRGCVFTACPCHWYEDRTEQARTTVIVDANDTTRVVCHPRCELKGTEHAICTWTAADPRGRAGPCQVCRVRFDEPVVTDVDGVPRDGRRRTCPACREIYARPTPAQPIIVEATIGPAVQKPPRNDRTVGGQVSPVPNASRPSWEVVIDDMRSRDDHGRTKYGTPLQPDNGRDSLWDAYEESLDQTVYLRNAIDEQRRLRYALANLITSWNLTAHDSAAEAYKVYTACADELERALRRPR